MIKKIHRVSRRSGFFGIKIKTIYDTYFKYTLFFIKVYKIFTCLEKFFYFFHNFN